MNLTERTAIATTLPLCRLNFDTVATTVLIYTLITELQYFEIMMLCRYHVIFNYHTEVNNTGISVFFCTKGQSPVTKITHNNFNTAWN